MAGPWEDYQPQSARPQASAGPWEDYSPGGTNANDRVARAFEQVNHHSPQTVSKEDFDAENAAINLANQMEERHGEYGAGALFQDNFTFGLQDEVAGIAHSLGGAMTGEMGKRYDIGRRAEQILLERAKERSGVGGTAASIAGAITSGAGAMKAGKAAGSFIGRLGALGKEGAIVGGLQGFGQSDGGVTDRLVDTAQGAAIGGAAGATVGAAFDGAKAAVKGGAKLVQAGKSALKSPTDKAISRISNAIADDGLTPQRVINRMSDGMVPADAAIPGGNVQGLARAAQAVPGKGRAIAEQTLRTRDIQAADRARKLVGDKLGVSNSLDDALETLLTKRSAEAQKAYGKAWAAPYSIGPQIDDLLKRVPESAFSDAKKIAALEGRPFMQQTVAKMGKEGVEEFTQTLSLEELHYVQQALRDQADTAFRSGSGAMGSKLKDLHTDLMGMMKRGSRDYRMASMKYADQSAIIDAMQRGSDFFKSGMKRLTPSEVGKMSLAERDAARVGVMNAVVQRLDDVSSSRDPFKVLFGRPGDVKLIKSFFDDPKKWQAFKKEMLQEFRVRQTSQFVRGGSPTARISEEVKGASDAAQAVGDVASGNFAGPIFKRIMQKLSGQELAPEVAEEISNILMRATPDGLARVNNALAKIQQTNKGISEIGDRLIPLVRALSQGTGATAGLVAAN